MRTDIDHIISLMKRYTTSNSNEELGEQEETPAAAPADAGGGTATNTGRKWETGLTRGPANMLGVAGEKWGTGLTRGHANPVP
jgi:hypothetical protein